MALYLIYLEYSDRQAWSNSADPDQMPQNVASDLGLYCLLFIQLLTQHFLAKQQLSIRNNRIMNQGVQIFQVSIVQIK